MTQPERITLSGPAGAIDVAIDPPAHIHGIALVAHPHPLFGGALENKVTHTLARSLRDLHYVALRPNFRGVGKTEGTHDQGRGETDDLAAVLDYAIERYGDLPVVLAGFSFGAHVQSRLAQRLAEAGTPPQRMVLVGAAVGTTPDGRAYDTPQVPADTVMIHGAKDETVPLDNVLAWAEPQNLPIVVVAGADHFFHGRLHVLREIILRAWRP